MSRNNELQIAKLELPIIRPELQLNAVERVRDFHVRPNGSYRVGLGGCNDGWDDLRFRCIRWVVDSFVGNHRDTVGCCCAAVAPDQIVPRIAKKQKIKIRVQKLIKLI